ncbi:MAG: heterodisulfide reductase subunit MvhD [Deltaproteobacteria bacterium RBG_13_60_28]|nr:MAG: heterodisulfide reductase subunit MvhD [Deltaproteobacteria bacterium RBG_13_60_28]
MSATYYPKVLAICCRWCSYAGADLAGAMRLQYPPAIRILMVPCTGRVDLLYLLQAFEVGADAVFVSGCHEGDCHYLTGNLQVRKRVERVKKILQEVGLEPERLEMFHISASEGPKFAAVAQEMTARALRLGPNPVKRQMRAAWLAEQAAAHAAA